MGLGYDVIGWTAYIRGGLSYDDHGIMTGEAQGISHKITC